MSLKACRQLQEETGIFIGFTGSYFHLQAPKYLQKSWKTYIKCSSLIDRLWIFQTTCHFLQMSMKGLFFTCVTNQPSNYFSCNRSLKVFLSVCLSLSLTPCTFHNVIFFFILLWQTVLFLLIIESLSKIFPLCVNRVTSVQMLNYVLVSLIPTSQKKPCVPSGQMQSTAHQLQQLHIPLNKSF